MVRGTDGVWREVLEVLAWFQKKGRARGFGTRTLIYKLTCVRERNISSAHHPRKSRNRPGFYAAAALPQSRSRTHLLDEGGFR